MRCEKHGSRPCRHTTFGILTKTGWGRPSKLVPPTCPPRPEDEERTAGRRPLVRNRSPRHPRRSCGGEAGTTRGGAAFAIWEWAAEAMDTRLTHVGVGPTACASVDDGTTAHVRGTVAAARPWMHVCVACSTAAVPADKLGSYVYFRSSWNQRFCAPPQECATMGVPSAPTSSE